MDRPSPSRTESTGAEPALAVLIIVLGVVVVLVVSGLPGLGDPMRLGLVPMAAVVAGGLVLRHRDRRSSQRRDAQLAAAVGEIREKSELLAGVAHEIQDPLTSLLGLSELLRDHASLSPGEVAEFIELMHGEANDLALLAEDLYVVSASAYGPDDRASAVDLLLETERASSSLGTVDRTVTVYGDRVVATTNSTRLRHILRSLLSHVERFGGPNVEITVQSRNGRPTVIIADDGPPLDSGATAALGAGTAAGRSGRSGLRVAIARMMAASIGAELDYERSPGWTHFVLVLSATD